MLLGAPAKCDPSQAVNTIGDCRDVNRAQEEWFGGSLRDKTGLFFPQNQCATQEVCLLQIKMLLTKYVIDKRHVVQCEMPCLYDMRVIASSKTQRTAYKFAFLHPSKS